MKRKVGGWILFVVGLWMLWVTVSTFIDYGGPTVGAWIEAALLLALGIPALWGGWKLAHSTPKIKEDESEKCLTYLEQEYKLAAFQDREAERFNHALLRYGNSNYSDSIAQQMCPAALRLADAAREIVKRRHDMTSIPDVASNMYSAWLLTSAEYLAWTEAQVAAMAALSQGLEPSGSQLQKLLLQSEKTRRKAMNEEQKLLKRFRLSSDEISRILNNAITAVEAADWQPTKR